jgi:hypothetical protein
MVTTMSQASMSAASPSMSPKRSTPGTVSIGASVNAQVRATSPLTSPYCRFRKPNPSSISSSRIRSSGMLLSSPTCALMLIQERPQTFRLRNGLSSRTWRARSRSGSSTLPRWAAKASTSGLKMAPRLPTGNWTSYPDSGGGWLRAVNRAWGKERRNSGSSLPSTEIVVPGMRCSRSGNIVEYSTWSPMPCSAQTNSRAAVVVAPSQRGFVVCRRSETGRRRRAS